MFGLLSKFLITSILVFQFVAAPLFLVPQKTEAAAGILQCIGAIASFIGIGNLIGTAVSVLSVPIANLPIQGNTAVTSTATSGTTIKECVLDALVIIIKEALIAELTESIINWINSGFEGGPSFITNPEDFFTDVADKSAGAFIQELGLGLLCEPFRIDIQIALTLKYFQNRRQEFECTLTDVMANIQDFQDGLAGMQNWDQWFSVTTNPMNDPMGAFDIGTGFMGIRISGASGSWQQQLNFGSGQIGLTVCVQEVPNPANPAETICLKYETKTPGHLVQDTLDKVTGTGLAQLEIADEIDEIISALLAYLANEILYGDNGLLGLSDPSDRNGGKSYFDLIHDDQGKNLTALKQQLITVIANMINTLAACLDTQTDPTIIAQLRAAIAYLRDLLTRVQAATTVAEIRTLQDEFYNPPAPITYVCPTGSPTDVPPPPDDGPPAGP